MSVSLGDLQEICHIAKRWRLESELRVARDHGDLVRVLELRREIEGLP